jgi:DNA-binding NarL/FixJ family response regulator
VAEAVAEAARVSPDVIVMDVRLPDGTGIEACREIRAARPETRVLMLTSYADDEAVYAAIIAGAAGYLLKQTRGRELVIAIEAVARGDSLLDPSVVGKVLERMRDLAGGGHKDKLSELSEQERRILGQIAEGKTNREIAAIVYLSEKTVKNYVSTILGKLGMERRAQAAAFLADRKARGHE